jgi:hypothetical protein
MCFKPNIQVVGGASKLLASLRGDQPIISWSDNRWSQGNVYKEMGFTLGQELPQDYSYVDLKKPYRRISKQSQKKSNTNCPTSLTERQWCAERGLARIWDCGKKRWILNP